MHDPGRPIRPAFILVLMVLALAWPGRLASACDAPRVQWTLPLEPPPGETLQPSHPLVARLTDDDGDGDVDGDDPLDLLVVVQQIRTLGGDVIALDAATGVEHWRSPVRSHGFWVPAVGDIDGVPGAEVVIVDEEEGVSLLDGRDGTRLWQVFPPEATFRNAALHVSIANVDATGAPEIIVGRAVLAADGSLVRALDLRRHDYSAPAPTVAVDLIPSSPGLEMTIGNGAWTSDGERLWGTFFGTNISPGYVAAADLDGDRRAEVLVTEQLAFGSGSSATPALHVLDTSGDRVGRFSGSPGSRLSAPTVADVDGDGVAEVLIADATRLRSISWIGFGFAIEWTVPIADPSCCSAASAFDFDGDGAAEVLYNGEESFVIVDGRTGAVLHERPWSSLTRWERPVVVNLDDDDAAEIVLVGTEEITVLECDAVVPPRCTWNQLAYHVENVEGDGTIPRVEDAVARSSNTWGGQVAGGCAAGAGAGCTTWPDLLETIETAAIDVEGVRHSFRTKAQVACDADEAERDFAAANQLCALIHELRAQQGRHLTPDEAQRIEDCARSVAAAADLSLERCRFNGRRPPGRRPGGDHPRR